MKLLQQRTDPVNLFVRRVEIDWVLKVTQGMAFITQCGMDRLRTGCASIFDEPQTLLLTHSGSHGAFLVEFYLQIPSS